ncbi:MAG TPA: N-acetylornithine carbamoyltransferase [Saprospiraceae bacterium]|nr:N-acetylornithine carbamoyltransferase [Saprospiraceae bacterium]
MIPHFYDVHSIPDIGALIQRTLEIKHHSIKSSSGKNKTIALIFLNPSLRTRISTQEAAYRLSMNVICMNSNDAWTWELEEGALMNSDRSEHIKDAVKVLSGYVDYIGIRCFAGLKNIEEDRTDRWIRTFMKYAEVPVINLESATLHPLQSLADMTTIEELFPGKKLNVVLTWAPHPKALPQAVPNSFAQWSLACGHHLTIVHPQGFELDRQYSSGARILHDQEEAFENADIIYVKNWCSTQHYGIASDQYPHWTVNQSKCKISPNARIMHCLPVRRNVVISDQVLDGPQSAVYIQAQNRLFAAQTVLEHLLKHDRSWNS